MTRLFIENREIELDESVQFAITKQFEDLSNPTAIINDWSKTVSIPFTATNNEIFGHIYNPDRLIVVGSSDTLTGIYFDPLKKLDMRLQYGDNVLMTGYAKMNEIKQSNGKGTYELTLFGQLGKVLQEMSKITFDQTYVDENYIIDGQKYVSETYNKDLIKNSWTSSGQIQDTLYPRKLIIQGGTEIAHPAYKVTDIIGFAPNNSFDDGFDYTVFQTTGTSTDFSGKKFTDELNDIGFEGATGVNPDNVIPNGLLPREIGEYRSYLQIPFIYWNKLFQLFQYKAEEVSGYKFDLDEWWFNRDNPYWFNLVYMLQRAKFNNENNDKDLKNSYVPAGEEGDKAIDPQYTEFEHILYNSVRKFNPVNEGAFYLEETHPLKFLRQQASEQINLLNKNEMDFSLYNIPNNTDVLVEFHIPFSIFYRSPVGTFGIPLSYGRLTANNAMDLRLEVKDSNNNILKTIKVLVLCEEYSGSTTGYDVVIPYSKINYYEKVVSGAGYVFGKSFICEFNDFDIDFNMNFSDLVGKTIHIDAKTYWKTAHPPVDHFGYDWYGYLTISLDKTRYFKINVSEKTRSGSAFTLNDLWNNDVNIFDEIIRYCKMFHILISVDYIKKTVSFKPMFKKFENYSILDWTNKVDKSKDFNINPVTFEDKYILFNNESVDTDLSKEYKEQTGLSYGSYRIISNYNFNNNTKELFKNCKESITNTDSVLSWSNLHDNKRIIYSLPAEIYVYNKDKDKKFVNTFGSFYFHNGLRNFDTDPKLALCSVKITDDSDYMKFNKKYFYLQGAVSTLSTSCTTYPDLDIINDVNLCLFAAPKKVFTYNGDYSYKNGIYNNLWENYIDERYNIQNKKVTCYVNLKPEDYMNFDFNKFIKIGNQIYMVNKIYDYNVTSNNPTKVDLITVQNIGAYTNKPYQYDYIRMYKSDMTEIGVYEKGHLTVPYDHYKKIYIESSKQWNIEYNDWPDYLAIEPTEGGPGLTPVYIGSIDEQDGAQIEFYLSSDIEPNKKLKSKFLNVDVGGQTSLKVSPWFNSIQQGGSATITINSSSNWKKVYQNNDYLTMTPTSGTAGTKTATIKAPQQSNLITDFYIENNAGDIVSVRGSVK